MMLLRASFIALIAIIGASQSQNSSFPELLDIDEKTDLGYRPWDHDDTFTMWISLEGMGITSINSMFRLNIPDLKWLVLDGNNIESIPSDTFKFLPNLTYISLARNQIRSFESSAFSYLEKLQVLDLDENYIQERVDYSIFSTLVALKRLYLRNCQLSYFDLPAHMNNLSYLYLSGNQLQTFTVTSDSALTHLYLQRNAIRDISLAELKSLIYLDLSNNQLNKIMRRFDAHIYFGRTYRNKYNYGYSSDEQALYLEDAPALQHLIVSSNLLEIIEPDIFLEIKALVHIDLTGNQIIKLSAGTFNNLLKVENILLDSNKITQINHRAFGNLPNLKTISLKNNEINDVDEDAFARLNSNTNEVFLFLDNNKIHTLRRGSFKDIKGLKHIGLSGNMIMTISSGAFINLPNLESIVIENQLHYEPSDYSDWRYQTTQSPLVSRNRAIASDAFFNLSNLTSITIRGNAFTDIEAKAFHQLPKLTLLDLSNNSIETLSSEAFYELPVLENLYLGNNMISEIGPGTFPKQLKHLGLAWNRVCPEFSCWHIEDLPQLEELDVSGIIDRFKIENFADFSENLTVIVGKAEFTSNSPARCY